MHIGLMWHALGSWGLQGWPLQEGLRSCPHFQQPSSAGSKADLLLPKAAPISNAGGTSVVTYVRKGKNTEAAVRVRREENARETTLQTPRLAKRE